MDSRTVDAAAAVGTKGLICKSDICTFFSIKHAGPDKYYPDTTTIKGLTESFCTVPTELFKHKQAIFTKYGITKRESMFLLLNAMGLDYREIAEIMFISVKTVDNLFNRVSKKLGTLNRHALTLFCIRMGLVKVATVQTGTPLNVGYTKQ
jgi:DNA-binding NarL/FixJ family response regulator